MSEETTTLLKEVPGIDVPTDLFINTEFKMNPDILKEEPHPQPSLGYSDELNNAKKKITPHVEKWDSSVKFLLSEFELIDIYRNPKFAYQRYNEPIIKYRSKMDTDESKGRFPIFSRAYFKLWEVLETTHILDRFRDTPLTIGCVAEGPGGFMHCLMDNRKKQNGLDWNKDEYYSITLKIGEGNDAKALDWDHFKSKEYFDYVKSTGNNVNLSYGEDGTGNMFNLKNLTHFVEKDLGNKKCQLVTGDGGIDLSSDEEFDIQELVNAPLFYAEILYCFHIQETNGSFILKIYDIYYNVTVQLILLLKLFYEKVRIVKPHTSRPASSEKYLVCEGFKGASEEQLQILRDILYEWVGKTGGWNGLDKSTFAERIISFNLDEAKVEAFRSELAKFNAIFSESQISKINRGLELCSKGFIPKDDVMAIKKQQKDIAIAWCEKHGMPYNPDLVLQETSTKSHGGGHNQRGGHGRSDGNWRGRNDRDNGNWRGRNDRDNSNWRRNDYRNDRRDRDDDRGYRRDDRRDRRDNSRDRSRSPHRGKMYSEREDRRYDNRNRDRHDRNRNRDRSRDKSEERDRRRDNDRSDRKGGRDRDQEKSSTKIQFERSAEDEEKMRKRAERFGGSN